MAKWYNETFGFEIVLSSDADDEKAVAFLKINNSGPMIELIKLPQISSTSTHLNHYLQYHLAIKSDDIAKDSEKLMKRGASFIEVCL